MVAVGGGAPPTVCIPLNAERPDDPGLAIRGPSGWPGAGYVVSPLLLLGLSMLSGCGKLCNQVVFGPAKQLTGNILPMKSVNS